MPLSSSHSHTHSLSLSSLPVACGFLVSIPSLRVSAELGLFSFFTYHLLVPNRIVCYYHYSLQNTATFEPSATRVRDGNRCAAIRGFFPVASWASDVCKNSLTSFSIFPGHRAPTSSSHPFPPLPSTAHLDSTPHPRHQRHATHPLQLSLGPTEAFSQRHYSVESFLEVGFLLSRLLSHALSRRTPAEPGVL